MDSAESKAKLFTFLTKVATAIFSIADVVNDVKQYYNSKKG